MKRAEESGWLVDGPTAKSPVTELRKPKWAETVG